MSKKDCNRFSLDLEEFVVVPNELEGETSEHCTQDESSTSNSMSLAAASQTTSTIDTGDLTERASTSNGNEVSDQHSKQKINFGICGSFDLLDDDDLNDSDVQDCNTFQCMSPLVLKVQLNSRENSREDYLLLADPKPTASSNEPSDHLHTSQNTITCKYDSSDFPLCSDLHSDSSPVNLPAPMSTNVSKSTLETSSSSITGTSDPWQSTDTLPSCLFKGPSVHSIPTTANGDVINHSNGMGCSNLTEVGNAGVDEISSDSAVTNNEFEAGGQLRGDNAASGLLCSSDLIRDSKKTSPKELSTCDNLLHSQQAKDEDRSDSIESATGNTASINSSKSSRGNNSDCSLGSVSQQYEIHHSSSTPMLDRNNVVNSPVTHRSRHESDPGRKPLYLKKKNIYEISRAFSEPTKSDLVTSDLLTEISDWSSSQSNLKNQPGSLIPAEKSIEDCIKKNCNDFVKYTNWQMLLPYLFSNELLDEHSSELLRNDLTTNHHKGLTFYLEILPSKGKTAYTRFYDCIAKEDQHSGHKTLLELMNKLA